MPNEKLEEIGSKVLHKLIHDAIMYEHGEVTLNHLISIYQRYL